MDHHSLTSLLDDVAERGVGGLHIYPPGNTHQDFFISYSKLRDIAIRNASRLRCLPDFRAHAVYLLHFDNHEDNIIWFWSVAYANCVPAMSTPFTKNADGRLAHIQHLHSLLDDPICLTRQTIVPIDFADNRWLRVTCVDDLERQEALNGHDDYMYRSDTESSRPDGLAILMLTSGSTGNAKAVCLNHSNLLASVKGKTAVLSTPINTTFFNFIGMDHVAALIEGHLLAMYTGASQVHVQASDVIPDPLEFVLLMHKHRVSRTMAPHFFLAKLLRAMETAEARLNEDRPDLSCLKYIMSGGEANLVETADALSLCLHSYGAPRGCIAVGFGMTETCAGSIYNTRFPDYDVGMGYEFASVGKCCPGIEMRITSATGEVYSESNGAVANPAKNGGPAINGVNGHNGHSMNPSETKVNGTHENASSFGKNVVGNLEVRGEIVFTKYYNNPIATQSSFTKDGWFSTGDLATIDELGHLNIVGRTKDSVTINGVKYLPHEIESAIDEADIPGVTPSFTATFSQRFPGAHTEHICVLYLPTYAPDDTQARLKTLNDITKIVVLQTGSKPQVLPLDQLCLPKTTLGKLQRSKLKSSLEKGEFAQLQEVNEAAVNAFRKEQYIAPVTETERRMLKIFQDVLELEDGVLGVETPYFEAGLTSIDLIKIRRQLEIAFSIPEEIPIITIITQSTVRALSRVLTSFTSVTARPYDPVVTLNHFGNKTPLFLIHPGVGEILVFFGLVKFFNDRPIHAIRARGFNKGEPLFNSLDEVIDTYYAAIRETQPKGPYAIAGYSWGSMLAFELSKKLEADGETVGFLGAFNLPPHIKWRMRQFDWIECIIHLAYFSGLISEESTSQVGLHMRTLTSRKAQLDHLVSISSQERLEELALTPASLESWADVGYALQSSAVDYEPKGRTSRMDVFYCNPLKILGITKQQWKEQHLQAWEEFVEDVQYHEVNGAHYTMLLPEHVGSFQRTLKAVLKMRGV